MARVKVLYFAAAREAAGRSDEVLHLKPPMTAGRVLDALIVNHPALAPMKKSVRIAVNHEVVPSGKPVEDGDEVAILPPVAGG